MFKLSGKVQHYAWGGNAFIPALLGISNTENRPFAEYWLGVHPLAPATVHLSHNAHTGLQDMIRSQPSRYLGKRLAAHHHELPYLLKILDVKDMLSIQVHPSREQAKIGFDIENSQGIPADAPHRNYKDANHKPEMMLALGEFWLLHGFRKEDDLVNILSQTNELNSLVSIFTAKGYRGLYQYVMELPQQDVNQLIQPLAARILPLYLEGRLKKDHPDFWAARAMVTYPDYFDRGIFSIYFFNLVHLNPGEAIFQGAGLPHAYLEGQNVELMSNSDNVLRAGLTPKHVDVAELMKHTLFEAVEPEIMKPLTENAFEKVFLCPVPDFSLVRVTTAPGHPYRFSASGPEILLILSGTGHVDDKAVTTGQAFFVPAGEEVRINGEMDLVRAFVP